MRSRVKRLVSLAFLLLSVTYLILVGVITAWHLTPSRYIVILLNVVAYVAFVFGIAFLFLVVAPFEWRINRLLWKKIMRK